MKPSRGCSGITRHACTQLWATSAPSSLNSSGIEQPKQSQADLAARAKQAMEKQESKSTLSNFPTATMTTNYNPVWDTGSEGKINTAGIHNNVRHNWCGPGLAGYRVFVRAGNDLDILEARLHRLS